VLIDNLQKIINDLKNEYAKDEWVISKFIENQVMNLSPYDAYKNIDEIIQFLINKKNRSAWTEIFSISFALVRQSNTTEIPMELKNNIFAIGCISKSISSYDYNQYIELLMFYKIDFLRDFQVDTNQSIETIEKDIWQIPDYGSYVVQKSYEYRKIPIKNLSNEACRLLLGQDIGVNCVLPFVVEILKKDILAGGDLYDGDLLNSVLNIKSDYWRFNNTLYKTIEYLIENTTVIDDEIEKAEKMLNDIRKFA